MKHKKFLFMLLIAAVFSTTAVKAGGVYEGPEPGTHLIGIREGIGWGHLSANVVYDYSLARVWKGTFTIGGVTGAAFRYLHRREGGNGITLPLLLRTTYRFSVVVPQWEVYAAAMIGGFISIGPPYSSAIMGSPDRGVSGFVSCGLFAGTSYWFTKNFGVNLELGHGLYVPWANLGVKFKI